jgi:epoxyqueuosine reductase
MSKTDNNHRTFLYPPGTGSRTLFLSENDIDLPEEVTVLRRHEGDVSKKIVEKAKSMGASLAGIAKIASVRNSPSHRSFPIIDVPDDMKSVLIIALEHDESHPELDWYTGKGGTPGNRVLLRISRALETSLKEDFDITARSLPYHVENGGIFLKDAGVSAGLGIIGKNNLLITRDYGPRIRLRALFLDTELEPTGPAELDPCNGCHMPCLSVCPRNAFMNDSYSYDACTIQMKEDEANETYVEKIIYETSEGRCVKYCRACELVCPAGRP